MMPSHFKLSAPRALAGASLRFVGPDHVLERPGKPMASRLVAWLGTLGSRLAGWWPPNPCKPAQPTALAGDRLGLIAINCPPTPKRARSSESAMRRRWVWLYPCPFQVVAMSQAGMISHADWLCVA